MILTCPACDTRYSVDPNSLLPNGRAVRCAKCGNTWTERPPADMPRTIAAPLERDEPDDSVADEVEVPSIEEMTVRAERPLFRPRGSRTPTKREEAPKLHWGAIIGCGSFAAVLVGLVAGGVFLRGAIMTMWPPSTKLYEVVGLALPRVQALAIANVAPAWETEGDTTVIVVKGVITNLTDEAQPVPKLRGSLGDARQPPRKIFAWTFDPPVSVLEPRGSKEFVTRVPNPPTTMRTVEITFVVGG